MTQESAVQPGLPARRDAEQSFTRGMHHKTARTVRSYTDIGRTEPGALQSTQCALLTLPRSRLVIVVNPASRHAPTRSLVA